MSRPVQIRFLSSVAAAYDPVVHFLGFRPLWRAIADIAAPGPAERALDVCTGTGGAALELTRCGARVIGLDLAAGMLRRARRKSNRNGSHAGAQFVQMDARHLAFPDRSFSLVTCSMALHEMSSAERQEVLGEIHRVASERFVVAEYRVPPQPWARQLFRVSRAFEYVESDDFESFVRGDCAAWLTQVGFQVQTAHDVGAFRIWSGRVKG